ncbi:MAG TPA: hypothetical protein VML55_08430, partial [Planctomycetaceae bacterium]|nr:hypothetical protein [Planctomycetaceae bacterium]
DVSPEFAQFEQSGFGGQFLEMYQRQWSAALSQYQFGSLSEEGVVTTWLLGHEADEMGISISDEAVRNYLRAAASDKLRGQDLTRIRKEHGVSESQLFDMLRFELKARHVQILSEPRLLPTPEDFWDLFRRFNVRQELALTAVPVERFVETDKSPSRADLVEFFERYKNVYPSGSEPGFLQPRRVQLAYLEADFESLRNRMFPEPITEDEVRTYYETHRDEYRNPAYTAEPSGTPESEPAVAPPFPSPGPETPAPATGADNAASPETPATPAAPTAPAAPADAPRESPPDAGPAVGGDTDQGQAGLAPPAALVDVALIAQDDPAAPEPGQPADPAPATPPDRPQPADAQEAAPAPGDQPVAVAPTARQLPLPPPLPEDPVTEYLSFGEVRDRILSRLEQERDEQVRQEIERLMRQAERRMNELARAHNSPAGHPDKLSAGQVSERLQEFAGQHDLRYVETALLSYEELGNQSLGQMTDVNAAPFDETPPLVAQIFDSGPDYLYQRIQFRDLATGNQIITWKIQDVESHEPQYTDPGIEEQVLGAWRLAEALPQARERAEALAKLVREHPEQDMEQALAGQTITGAAGGLELTVRTTRPFTWLRQSTAPDPSRLSPATRVELSSVDGVDKPGEAFMATVFNELNDGDVGVATNSDKSVYYVVTVANRSSSSETGRKALFDDLLRAPLFDNQSPYPQILAARQQALGQAWFQRLLQKYEVQWNRPLDERMQSAL